MNESSKMNSQFIPIQIEQENTLHQKEIEGQINLNKVVECLSLPNYMRNINDVKKISHWIIKNTDIFHRIHAVRLQNDAIKNESEDNLIVAILCSSKIEIFQQSSHLFKVKDKAEKMYVLLDGSIQIEVQPKHFQSLNDMITTKYVDNGVQIGDLDLYLNSIRSSTATAKVKCVCLSIKKQVFDTHILEFYQSFYNEIMNFVFNLKVFDGISNKHQFIKSFFDSFSQSIRYSQGQVVFSEKNRPEYIYFIVRGSFLVKLDCLKQGSKLKSYKIHQYLQQTSFMHSKENLRMERDLILQNQQQVKMIQIQMKLSYNSFIQMQIIKKTQLTFNSFAPKIKLKIKKISLFSFLFFHHANHQITSQLKIRLPKLNFIYELQKGDFFGEEDIIDNLEFRSFTVMCSSVTGGELLQINREVFEQIFMKHYAIEQFFVQNLPIKKRLMVDKFQQHSKIIKLASKSEVFQQPSRMFINQKDILKEPQATFSSLNTIPQLSQKFNTLNYQNQQQFNKSIQSLTQLSKQIDEIQEESQDNACKTNSKNQENYYHQRNKSESIQLNKYMNYRVQSPQRQNERGQKTKSISSMNDLLDYAQSSIFMLQQQQQLSQTQFNQMINQNQDFIIDNNKRQDQSVGSLSNIDSLKQNNNNRLLSPQNYNNISQSQKRISSNDLCAKMDQEVDNKQKEYQAIKSIQQRMKQTFEFDMNNYMKQKIKMQKSIIQQKRRNSYSRKKSVKSQNNQEQKTQKSQSANNSPSTHKCKKKQSKPIITKWTNSLNQKDEEMVLQGEISKNFQKNLKQICFKFGRQDFSSLKQSLKNHIKSKDFKRILSANFSDTQTFQPNYNGIQDRSKGISEVAQKINYIQNYQVKDNKDNDNQCNQIQKIIPSLNEKHQEKNIANDENKEEIIPQSVQNHHFFEPDQIIEIQQVEQKQKNNNDKIQIEIVLNQPQLSTIQSQKTYQQEPNELSPSNSSQAGPSKTTKQNNNDQNYFKHPQKQLTFGCSPQSSMDLIELKLKESQQFSGILKSYQAQNNSQMNLDQQNHSQSQGENNKIQSDLQQNKDNQINLEKKYSNQSQNQSILKHLESQSQLNNNPKPPIKYHDNQEEKLSGQGKISIMNNNLQKKVVQKSQSENILQKHEQKNKQLNLINNFKEDHQIMQNHMIKNLLINKGVDPIDSNYYTTTNEGTLNTPEEDIQNQSQSFSYAIKPYFTTNPFSKQVNNQQPIRRKIQRPFSSSYHVSLSHQHNQQPSNQATLQRNHSYNNYPLDIYSPTNKSVFYNLKRPSSERKDSIQRSQSEQFQRLKEIKLNSQIDRSNEFKERKQINVVLNIKKSLLKQNRSNSPNPSVQSKIQPTTQNSKYQLQQIITPVKNTQCNDKFQNDSSMMHYNLSSNQINDKQILQIRKSQRLTPTTQSQNKSQLIENINQSINYYQQYIAQPQKQQIKYNFNRKLSSEINKSNINQTQYSKHFNKQQSTFNNYSQQYQVKSTPQKNYASELQTNHSSVLSNFYTPPQNMNSRSSSAAQLSSDQIEQHNQNINNQNFNQPTLFSPDMFQQSSQQNKAKDIKVDTLKPQNQNMDIINNQSTKNYQSHRKFIPKIPIPSSIPQNQNQSAQKDIALESNIQIKNESLDQQNMDQTPNFHNIKTFNFQNKQIISALQRSDSQQISENENSNQNEIKQQILVEEQSDSQQSSKQSHFNSTINHSVSNQGRAKQNSQQSSNKDVQSPVYSSQKNINPNLEVSFSQQRSSLSSEIGSPNLIKCRIPKEGNSKLQSLILDNQHNTNIKHNQNTSLMKYSLIQSTIPYIPEETSFDPLQQSNLINSPKINKNTLNTSIKSSHSLHLNPQDSPIYFRNRQNSQFSVMSNLNLTSKEQYTRNSIFFENCEIIQPNQQEDIQYNKDQQNPQPYNTQDYEKFHSNENSPRKIKIQEYLENNQQIPVAVPRQLASVKQYAPLHKKAQSLYKQ